MEFYNRCFEKHSFHELNDIDIDKLTAIFEKYRKMFGVKKDSVMVDVGTNAGSFVKVLDRASIHQNIHCFEPHPVLSKRVKEIYPYVIMNESCLTKYNGFIDIHIPMFSVGLSSIIKRPVFDSLQQHVTKLTVPAETFDSYCERNNIGVVDFVKIDVEGAEKMVLEGAHHMLSSGKILSGMFEVGATLTDAGTSTDELCNFIKNYGYTIDTDGFETDFYFYRNKS
jgi:FkbM family methyltransferase